MAPLPGEEGSGQVAGCHVPDEEVRGARAVLQAVRSGHVKRVAFSTFLHAQGTMINAAMLQILINHDSLIITIINHHYHYYAIEVLALSIIGRSGRGRCTPRETTVKCAWRSRKSACSQISKHKWDRMMMDDDYLQWIQRYF